MPPPAQKAMLLPAAKDLRDRANRVTARVALPGTLRGRYLRQQRRRLVNRLMPTLGMLAVATGAAALVDLFRQPPPSPGLSLTEGLTATSLAALALGCTAFRRDLRALYALCAVSSAVLICGWSLVAWLTGGASSPYVLAMPLAVTVMIFAVPAPPWLAPPVALLAVLGTALSCPGTPLSIYLITTLLGAAGFVIARTRHQRSLFSFKRVERLAHAVARMRQLQEELVVVEKLEALRVLVGGMAHEVNNALAVSLASVDQVAETAERDPAGAVKAARRAHGGLVRIRSTIDRLKRFALAEEAVLEAADVCSMLDFALESAVGRARSGVIIDRHYEQGVGSVECHVSGLAEALYQVAKNAIEAMPGGGTVRASVRREDGILVLSVADEGMGIPAARLAKVFDPFYARESPETFSGGRVLPPLPGRSGLGLSAVYGIITAMGGKVEIQSEVRRGTEVSIRLPSRRA